LLRAWNRQPLKHKLAVNRVVFAKTILLYQMRHLLQPLLLLLLLLYLSALVPRCQIRRVLRAAAQTFSA
jgi:hypothetical protein